MLFLGAMACSFTLAGVPVVGLLDLVGACSVTGAAGESLMLSATKGTLVSLGARVSAAGVLVLASSVGATVSAFTA